MDIPAYLELCSKLMYLCSLIRAFVVSLQLHHILKMETDFEIISTVIIPILLIQERQLSVTGESLYTSTG